MTPLDTRNSGEDSFLTQANVLMCRASELAAHPETQKEALTEFTKARKLFELLLAGPSTSDDNKDWCRTAIDEITAQIVHIETNMLGNVAPVPTESDKGVVYRVACSLDLVSCYSLSRDHEPTTLTDGSTEPIRLYVLNEQEGAVPSLETSAPHAFLQITPDAAYPLGANVPVLKASSGYYVFMKDNQEYYGIVFPQGYPEEAIKTFEQELAANCLLCVEDEKGKIVPVPAGNYSGDVLQVVEVPEEAPPAQTFWLANSITTGAEYVTWGISSTSNFLRSSIERAGSGMSSLVNRPDANSTVPTLVGAPVSFAKSVTPGVVYISGAAASGLASIASDIGGLLAKGAGAVMPGSQGSGAGSSLSAVGKASVGAVVNIWEELTGVGKNLIEGTQQATVQVVKSRYGPKMGSLASDFIGIGKDIYMTNKNIHGIGIQSLAKGSIKAAGTSFVKKVSSKTLALTEASAAAKKSPLKRLASAASSPHLAKEHPLAVENKKAT